MRSFVPKLKNWADSAISSGKFGSSEAWNSLPNSCRRGYDLVRQLMKTWGEPGDERLLKTDKPGGRLDFPPFARAEEDNGHA